MSENSKPRTSRRRRTALALAAGVAALGVAGSGVAMAASSDSSAKPAKTVAPNLAIHPQTAVQGSTVTLGPLGYSSGFVACPTNTLVWGGGESNNAPGTLFLTDSYPIGDTEWVVYVKNTDPSNTYTFTPTAICR